MGEITKIQWCDHTFNPWRGCTKVAAGCANCYADAQAKRNPGVLGIWGDHGTRVVASEDMWRQPIKWNRSATCQCGAAGAGDRECDWCTNGCRRPRVFCASMCDVFEDWDGGIVDSKSRRLFTINGDDWFDEAEYPECRGATLCDVRRRLFRLIDATPNLDWLMLTKRPENIRRMWVDDKIPWRATGKWHRDNCWLGTSIACQEDADRNIPLLLKCRDLGAKLFLSVEPLTEEVNLRRFFAHSLKCASYQGREKGFDESVRSCDCGRPRIDWVIVGGESGPNARPCNIEWIRSIVQQCRDACVPCFVKQLGANIVAPNVWPSDFNAQESNVRIRFRDVKGGDPSEWPEDLRVRQFPKIKRHT